MDSIPGWVEPVLIAAAVVFFLDLIGNMISFSNRFLNALTTALVFAIVFGTLIHFGLVRLDVQAMQSAVEVPAAMDAPAPAAETPAPVEAPAETPAPATP